MRTVISPVGNEYVALPGAACPPWPAETAFGFAFAPELELAATCRWHSSIVASRSDVDLEGALRDVEILDGDTDQMLALHRRLPMALVLPILGVKDATANWPVVRGTNMDLKKKKCHARNISSL